MSDDDLIRQGAVNLWGAPGAWLSKGDALAMSKWLIERGWSPPASPAAAEPDTRYPACVEAWPQCVAGEYRPHCCRFPKSCSCETPAEPTRADETCGVPTADGPCILPAGHNQGRADLPGNHSTEGFCPDCPDHEACATGAPCDKVKVVNSPMTERVLSVPSEDALFAFLDALNVSGIHPELPCVSEAGAAFLAGLTEPDADHVHITVTDADSGHVHCCQCSHPGERADEWDPNSWRPTYPVLALVTEWPDAERVAAEDHIDSWWTTTDPIRADEESK